MFGLYFQEAASNSGQTGSQLPATHKPDQVIATGLLQGRQALLLSLPLDRVLSGAVTELRTTAAPVAPGILTEELFPSRRCGPRTSPTFGALCLWDLRDRYMLLNLIVLVA